MRLAMIRTSLQYFMLHGDVEVELETEETEKERILDM